MPIATLLLIVDVALIVHAAKTGRFQPWGYIILVLPGIGALVYIVVELLPEWLGSYKGQVAQRTVARAVNPGRRYRELTAQLACFLGRMPGKSSRQHGMAEIRAGHQLGNGFQGSGEILQKRVERLAPPGVWPAQGGHVRQARG